MTDVYALGKLDILSASYKKDTSKNEEGDKEDKDPKMDKLFNEQLLPKMLDFEYEISNEKIDGDKATVDVNIKTYRLGDTISSFFGEYMSKAFALAFLDVSEDRLNALAVSILSGKIADFKEKTFEKTVTLQMSKKDGKWIVNEIEEGGDFIDAISGDLASSFENLESTFAAFEE